MGSNTKLATHIARAIFKCGDEPRGPATRLEYKTGPFNEERPGGGFIEPALARFLEEILDKYSALETCERHVPEGINSEHAVQGMSSPGSIHPLDDENGVRHAGNCARWHTPANSVKRTACNCDATLNRKVTHD